MQHAAKQLEDDIKAGAMGLKVFKDLGMFDRKADGSRLQVDDPELDAVWETCARLNVPVPILAKSEELWSCASVPAEKSDTGLASE